ncbi:WD40 repeat-containing protein [Handroanthus impetiginosus]|uniref:WD40 repeat-containing protein n=1 Tax=Handroanthus impetiginosus TaxID=429701 RepID=A0A2G9HAA9_9LAMI|nr:WD40 repeat-containing protein [Handroanthus impetiginosus]
MDSFSEDGEESRFFDAPEHIAQEPESVSSFPYDKNWEYDVWIGTPQSIRERRRKFMRWMGLSPDGLQGENGVDTHDNGKNGGFVGDMDRIMENNGAVLRSSCIEVESSLSCSSVSSWTTDDVGLSRGVGLSDCRNVDRNSNLTVQNGRLRKIQAVRSDRLRSSGEFEKVSRLSPSALIAERREIEVNGTTPRTMDRLKEKWLSKWRSMACMISRTVKDDNVELDSFSQAQGKRIQRVRVRQCRKKLKELSALFTGQDIQAHEGSILTMKFSLDGQYLASAGEDKIVRVWQVVEDERSDTIDIPDADPSCVYFSVNHLSELRPFMVEKDKVNKSKNLIKTRDSACIIFPPKVFRILEKPLHVFEGHSGEILDLSWSKDNCLLSSSVDGTVRLWRVGVDQCLKVFSHTDYVTCIQFNPVNNDYFISGSIDGKVRIWTISGCQVVDWTETRDIITAVSYRPDARGGIIGSISGTCRFFSISDNHFQLETEMCLTSKKKSPRITSFQFLPHDLSKVLVTCADSQVRIIDGLNVVGKYKGLRNTGNQISASFTPDGKHIISASEDSNVYIWNYTDHRDSSFPHPKVVKSFECFPSDASVAIPWPGLKLSQLHEISINPLPFLSSTCFSLSQEFLDSTSKGSATWPEEKLPSSPKAATSPLGKSHYKLFKTSCQNSLNSHAWGRVIVTAGWDGRIRSFHNYGLPVPI